MMTCPSIDHKVNAANKLITQYKESPKLKAVIDSLMDQSNEIEAALCQLLEERWVETAIGTQLDVLGVIVGQPRTIEEILANQFFGFLTSIGGLSFGTEGDASIGGVFRSESDIEYVESILDDATYRVFIKAKIKKNHSIATIDDVLDVVKTVLGISTNVIVTETTASFNLEFSEALTDTQKLILTRTNFTPKPAGVFADYTDTEGDFY